MQRQVAHFAGGHSDHHPIPRTCCYWHISDTGWHLRERARTHTPVARASATATSRCARPSIALWRARVGSARGRRRLGVGAEARLHPLPGVQLLPHGPHPRNGHRGGFLRPREDHPRGRQGYPEAQRRATEVQQHGASPHPRPEPRVSRRPPSPLDHGSRRRPSGSRDGRRSDSTRATAKRPIPPASRHFLAPIFTRRSSRRPPSVGWTHTACLTATAPEDPRFASSAGPRSPTTPLSSRSASASASTATPPIPTYPSTDPNPRPKLRLGVRSRQTSPRTGTPGTPRTRARNRRVRVSRRCISLSSP